MIVALLKFIAGVGYKIGGFAYVLEKRQAEASALKPGTRVTLGNCKCSSDHAGVWVVDRYNFDANDYRLSRVPTCEVNDGSIGFTYAAREALVVLSVNP